ncbi:deaminase [Candidatus Pacearchaeota archaeon]|nr:deaminase [Candidatus Pacearchaeota archaeon]
MVKRTFNTLFMLCSIDGKISTGNIDSRDVDKDFPKIKGISEGLRQYYELEMRTDSHSFNTGRVMAKMGINKPKEIIKKLPVSFIIVDNKPHLNNMGVNNLLKKCNILYIVTTNKKHPAFKVKEDNLKVIFYKGKVNLFDLFSKLKTEYGVDRVTIQSGGTMNASLIRERLIDEVSLVVAPAIIGGKDTSTLVDGESLCSEKDLLKIRPLRIKEVHKLENSFIHLVYQVIN